MEFGSRNQLANVSNPYQGPYKKVLCVCSAGLLRSPTMAAYLNREYGFNTRSCGASEEYALIPMSHALLLWADEVHVVKEQQGAVEKALEKFGLEGTKVVVLPLPDQYEAFSFDLEEKIEDFYYEHGV